MTSFKSTISSDSVLEINGVVKKYEEEKTILDGFSLNINKGEIICLLGANGSGKTTLVNILTGLTDLDEGDALLH
jgi:iron(III) transport system ATP-binding protein